MFFSKSEFSFGLDLLLTWLSILGVSVLYIIILYISQNMCIKGCHKKVAHDKLLRYMYYFSPRFTEVLLTTLSVDNQEIEMVHDAGSSRLCCDLGTTQSSGSCDVSTMCRAEILCCSRSRNGKVQQQWPARMERVLSLARSEHLIGLPNIKAKLG